LAVSEARDALRAELGRIQEQELNTLQCSLSERISEKDVIIADLHSQLEASRVLSLRAADPASPTDWPAKLPPLPVFDRAEKVKGIYKQW